MLCVIQIPCSAHTQDGDSNAADESLGKKTKKDKADKDKSDFIKLKVIGQVQYYFTVIPCCSVSFSE